jgi:hypothetical protein
MSDGPICGIYGIFSLKSSDCLYVGKTTNFSNRVESHKTYLRNEKHSCKGLQFWYNQQNTSNISAIVEFRVLELVKEDPLLLSQREIFWFNDLKPKFWGIEPFIEFKWKVSPEVRKKIYQKRGDEANKKFSKNVTQYGDLVQELYQKRQLSIVKITNQIPELSYATVRRIVILRGGVRSQRDNIGAKFSRGKSQEELKEIIATSLAKDGSWEATARGLECSPSSLRNLSVELGLLVPQPNEKNIKEFHLKSNRWFSHQIQTRYIDGNSSLEELALDWDVSTRMIKKRIAQLDLLEDVSANLSNRKMRLGLRKIKDLEELRYLYVEGWNFHQLSQKYECSSGIVRRTLRSMGIEPLDNLVCSHCGVGYRRKNSNSIFCCREHQYKSYQRKS